MPKFIWSSPRFLVLKPLVDATLAAYFLLFAFTFKVGKSYENSVNHGGNTSYQSHDKIDCHTYAFLVNYFQEKLLESFACKTR